MIIDPKIVGSFCKMLLPAKKIVIAGHHNPDGDCIGSLTGLKAWLECFFKDKEGVRVSMVVPNHIPYYLMFMDGADSVVLYSEKPDEARSLLEEADTIICMDLNDLARTEEMADIIRKSTARKIMIDHHPFPEKFADLTVSKTEVSSASELAWWLVSEASKKTGTEIPLACKASLYTGMMTDTNNFCNSVFPSTFLMASQIAEAGIDREKIQMEIMNSFSEERMRLMGLMLKDKMTIFPDLKAAVLVLDQETKDRYNYRDGDSEGFVNLPLKIKNVEISALFTQGNGYIKVSLRSKGAVSVNRFCRLFFNGGGHERAAGGRLYDKPIEEVTDYFEKSLRMFLGGFSA
ncbi:MAG: DHH family phosphoesterase [Bacteroidales bacterium]|nr:DHH family phosphoesterase [Bacteroidales bacterium]